MIVLLVFGFFDVMSESEEKKVLKNEVKVVVKLVKKKVFLFKKLGFLVKDFWVEKFNVEVFGVIFFW